MRGSRRGNWREAIGVWTASRDLVSSLSSGIDTIGSRESLVSNANYVFPPSLPNSTSPRAYSRISRSSFAFASSIRRCCQRSMQRLEMHWGLRSRRLTMTFAPWINTRYVVQRTAPHPEVPLGIPVKRGFDKHVAPVDSATRGRAVALESRRWLDP